MDAMFKSKKILVAGDFMLDIYTSGAVRRISPEAPVPILLVKEERRVPGGAGNTILNLVSLGMEVVAVGRVGNDQAGRDFLAALADENVDTRGIFVDDSFQTPQKNRMMAGGQQIVRIDYEEIKPLSMRLYEQVKSQLPQLLKDIDMIAISDYAKGFLIPALLQAIISYDVPVIVDPKGFNFTRYWGAMLLKPNLGEAFAAAGLGMEATLDEVADVLLEGVKNLMITRSEEGISLFSKEGGRRDFPALVHEVRDVTGAGDTVLAVVTAALANGYTLDEASKMANAAAAIAIECLGCARVTADQIRKAVVTL